jgi:hypothetical protein
MPALNFSIILDSWYGRFAGHFQNGNYENVLLEIKGLCKRFVGGIKIFASGNQDIT